MTNIPRARRRAVPPRLYVRLGGLFAVRGDGTLIVFCHHGMRSMNVVNWLRGQGIEACQSMAGGIEAWSASIDLSVPRY